MPKTYVPSLVRMVHKMNQYIVRYRTTLDQNLDTSQEAALDALAEACANFEQEVTIEILP